MPIWIIRDIRSQPGVELKGLRDGSGRAADDGYLPPGPPTYAPPVADFVGEIVAQGPGNAAGGESGLVAPMMMIPADPQLVGYAPLTVRFTDLSSGPPTSWAWDFMKDGSCGSNATNPTFVYEDPGVYSVRLSVANELGSDSKTRVDYIKVLARQLAARTFYLGESPYAEGGVSGPAKTSHDDFMAALSVARISALTDGLEQATGSTELTLHGGLSTLTGGDGPGTQITSNVVHGRFNTTAGGSKWWETSESFSVAFSSPVKAFGAYVTDSGDFGGTLQVHLTGSRGTEAFPIEFHPSTSNASLAFFGFVDTTDATYSEVRFTIQQQLGDEDFIGLDDITVGILNP